MIFEIYFPFIIYIYIHIYIYNFILKSKNFFYRIYIKFQMISYILLSINTDANEVTLLKLRFDPST